MPLLPSEFSDLEPFAGTWCLATEHERWARRSSSSMEELQSFYDAALPRVPDAIKYCDRYPLDDMAEDALNLLRLVYSFAMISFPIELWSQTYPPDTRGTDFVRISEPFP